VNFAKFSIDNYPAKYYALVVWNHGMGWKNKPIENALFKGVSYDDQSGNHISTPDLGRATADIAGLIGRKLDILAFDACLMQMMEVGFEVIENVDYMVASEETEPGDGWNYTLALGPLMKKPTTTPLSFAKILAQAYGQHYASQNATLSAVKLADLKPLAEAVSELAVAISEVEGAEGANIKKIVQKTQKFAIADNIDLAHFTKQVLDEVKNEKIKTAAEKVLMLQGKAVFASVANGSGMKNASGLAIYFPCYSFNANYSKIKFSEYKWDEMVLAITKVQAVAENDAPAPPPSSGSGWGSHPDDYPDVWHPGMPGWHPLPPMY
jgi:hypothetical protein